MENSQKGIRDNGIRALAFVHPSQPELMAEVLIRVLKCLRYDAESKTFRDNGDFLISMDQNAVDFLTESVQRLQNIYKPKTNETHKKNIARANQELEADHQG